MSAASVAASPIRLVAGLGNPGREYENTRHNAGFLVIDRLAVRLGLTLSFSNAWQALWGRGTDGCTYLKPMTFMNASGRAVRACAGFYKVAAVETLIVYDDLALPLGQLRLRKDGSSGGQNGMQSVIEHFGTATVPRLRLGIGTTGDHRSMVDHVLGQFTAAERRRARRGRRAGGGCRRARAAARRRSRDEPLQPFGDAGCSQPAAPKPQRPNAVNPTIHPKEPMKNRYEGLLVLDTQGKEDTVKETIERLEKDFEKEGAAVEQVQKMEKRDFSYSAGRAEQRLLRQLRFQRRADGGGKAAGEVQTRPGSVSSKLPEITCEKGRQSGVILLRFRHGEFEQSHADRQLDA